VRVALPGASRYARRAFANERIEERVTVDGNGASDSTERVLDEWRNAAYNCFSSGHKFCREVCPVLQVTHDETHSPTAFHANVVAMEKGLLTIADVAADYVNCTQCGACELHGIAIQDRVLLGGSYADRDYAARRKDAFVVAVNCFEPGGTCFCVSMGTGPKAETGYDLALTEILDGAHRLLVEIGSERGAEVLRDLPRRPALPDDLDAAGAAVAGAVERMGRRVDVTDIRDLLARNLENKRWDDVAARCLTCGNCTLVCPTCFCTSVEDVTDLTGEHAERIHYQESAMAR